MQRVEDNGNILVLVVCSINFLHCLNQLLSLAFLVDFALVARVLDMICSRHSKHRLLSALYLGNSAQLVSWVSFIALTFFFVLTTS